MLFRASHEMSKLTPASRVKYSKIITRFFKWLLLSEHSELSSSDKDFAQNLQTDRNAGLNIRDIDKFLAALFLRSSKNLLAEPFAVILFTGAVAVRESGETVTPNQLSSMVAQILYWGRACVLKKMLQHTGCVLHVLIISYLQ
jgi:hypothetical protein